MFLKEFFYMPKSDRRTILFICTSALVLVVLFGAAALVSDKSNDVHETNQTKKHKMWYNDRRNRNDGYKNDSYEESDEYMAKNRRLFYFDPNTADSTQLRQLGLREWQIRNIYKYRKRGGVYRCKEDFAYVYGLTAGDYRRLAPYIRIAEDFRPASSLAEVKNRKYEYGKDIYNNGTANGNEADGKQIKAYSPKIHIGEYIEINSADTTELMKIPGIGSYFSRRITRYRDMLGGFASREQLLEIDNFPEEAIKYVAINQQGIHKLRVNQLSLTQLKRHPYLNYYQARALTDFRRLHGKIKSLSELKLLKEFSEHDIKRLEPYVEF